MTTRWLLARRFPSAASQYAHAPGERLEKVQYEPALPAQALGLELVVYQRAILFHLGL